MAEWLINCQLDYLRISFGESHTHSYTSSITLPTCTEQGYTTYTCECGDSYVADYVDANGHDFSADRKCQACGALLGDVTGEGKVTALDLALLNVYVNGQIALDSKELSVCDINRDGAVAKDDAVLLKNYLLEK